MTFLLVHSREIRTSGELRFSFIFYITHMTITVKGKEISKMNATKHWLTSNAMISKEEKTIFENSKKELSDFLKPDWMIEKMLIENIAFYFVKLQRSINIEAMQVILQWIESEIAYKQSLIPETKVIWWFEEMWLWEEEHNVEKEKIEWEVEILKKEIFKIQSWTISIEWIDNLWRVQRYHTAIENRLFKAIKQFYEIRKSRNASKIG